jgi:hypothetical protein
LPCRAAITSGSQRPVKLNMSLLLLRPQQASWQMLQASTNFASTA